MPAQAQSFLELVLLRTSEYIDAHSTSMGMHNVNMTGSPFAHKQTATSQEPHIKTKKYLNGVESIEFMFGPQFIWPPPLPTRNQETQSDCDGPPVKWYEKRSKRFVPPLSRRQCDVSAGNSTCIYVSPGDCTMCGADAMACVNCRYTMQCECGHEHRDLHFVRCTPTQR